MDLRRPRLKPSGDPCGPMMGEYPALLEFLRPGELLRLEGEAPSKDPNFGDGGLREMDDIGMMAGENAGVTKGEIGAVGK